MSAERCGNCHIVTRGDEYERRKRAIVGVANVGTRPAMLIDVGNDRFPTAERGRIAAGYKKRSNGAGGRSQLDTSKRRGAQRKPREVGAEPKPRQRHRKAYPRGWAFRVRQSVPHRTARLDPMGASVCELVPSHIDGRRSNECEFTRRKRQFSTIGGVVQIAARLNWPCGKNAKSTGETFSEVSEVAHLGPVGEFPVDSGLQ
jgi:hypothetical protein